MLCRCASSWSRGPGGRRHVNSISNEMDGEAFRAPRTPWIQGPLPAQYLYGAAFSADGRLLFQPGLQNTFRARVALPVALSPNFRALVSNNKDNRIIAITGSAGDGIAVIDLSSLPEPVPLTWLPAVAAPAVIGNPQASDTANQRRLENPFATIRRRPSPLLRGLAQPRHQ